MTEGERAVLIAVIGASASIAVAVFGALAAYLASKRDRRRSLYSDAVKAIVSWKEQLYRVRRRQTGQEAELIGSFHDLQDQLSYYQAWVGSDSKYMKRSYDRLVQGVKRKTEKLITAAWSDPIRPVGEQAQQGDAHPNLEELVDAFLCDVRSHLSPLPWRKIAVAWRNRKKK